MADIGPERRVIEVIPAPTQQPEPSKAPEPAKIPQPVKTPGGQVADEVPK